MPKLNSSFPSLRKHRASGQAVVTIAGKDYYLGPHGSKTAQRAYDAKIAEWLASGRSSSFGIAAAELTIAELLNSYRKFAEKYYGTGEKSTYHDMARAASRVKALYATLAVSEFGPLQFKAIRQKMIDAKLARVYINKTMSFILKIFKWGTAEGMVPVEVFHRIKAVESLRMGFTEAPERDAVLPVDVALVHKTIPFMPAVIQEMVKLHLLIGCRPGELCHIKPSMIDRSSEIWRVDFKEHKTAKRGKSRVIYLGPKAQAIVTPFLDRGADKYLFSPQESERKRRQVAHENRSTPMNQGNRPGYSKRNRAKRKSEIGPSDHYTTSSYGRAIIRACKAASVEQWSPNQIRHTVATDIRKRFGLEAAATLLGHSELSTTQIYAEQDIERAIHVAGQYS